VTSTPDTEAQMWALVCVVAEEARCTTDAVRIVTESLRGERWFSVEVRQRLSARGRRDVWASVGRGSESLLDAVKDARSAIQFGRAAGIFHLAHGAGASS
jgi:hypothetical protein